MNICMVASEALPYCKSGGLADVVYSLSLALKKLKHEVTIVLPYYETIKDHYPNTKKIGSFFVYMSWRKQLAEIYMREEKGLTYYFIGNDFYFERPQLYGFDDDGERFAFFQLAFRKLLKFVNLKPDIIHVHDWQSGMIPTLIHEQNYDDPFFQDMRFVLTIHNPAFKGMIDRYYLRNFYDLDDSLYDMGKVRFQGMVSTLKSGIIYADKITTVSPTHRNELLVEESGQGLASVLALRTRDFVGILNGIDTKEWNPKTDPLLARNYTKTTVEEGKHLCQADVLRSFRVHWYNRPVYGIVSRLSWQKGIDLVIHGMRKMLKTGANLLILGSGEYEMEKALEDLRREFPETVGIFIGFSNELAHKIYAGSDFFLMPSLFEPCGISQMISERYGTLPIVRKTGGLADTVVGFNGTNEKIADGIVFNDYNDTGLSYALEMSEKIYNDQDLYYKLAKNGMSKDWSWKNSAEEYQKLYQELLK